MTCGSNSKTEYIEHNRNALDVPDLSISILMRAVMILTLDLIHRLFYACPLGISILVYNICKL